MIATEISSKFGTYFDKTEAKAKKVVNRVAESGFHIFGVSTHLLAFHHNVSLCVLETKLNPSLLIPRLPCWRFGFKRYDLKPKE